MAYITPEDEHRKTRTTCDEGRNLTLSSTTRINFADLAELSLLRVSAKGGSRIVAGEGGADKEAIRGGTTPSGGVVTGVRVGVGD